MEHLKRHGDGHKCPRCRYMRQKSAWSKILTYASKEGGVGCWLEERCEPGHVWGLGCKVCRWQGVASAWGRTEVRGWRGTRLSIFRRHGGHSPGSAGGADHRRHENAALALLAEPTSEPRAKDRNDVPARPLCYTAYKGAKVGDAFTKYTADLCNNRACGAPIQLSRSSPIIA